MTEVDRCPDVLPLVFSSHGSAPKGGTADGIAI